MRHPPPPTLPKSPASPRQRRTPIADVVSLMHSHVPPQSRGWSRRKKGKHTLTQNSPRTAPELGEWSFVRTNDQGDQGNQATGPAASGIARKQQRCPSIQGHTPRSIGDRPRQGLQAALGLRHTPQARGSSAASMDTPFKRGWPMLDRKGNRPSEQARRRRPWTLVQNRYTAKRHTVNCSGL